MRKFIVIFIILFAFCRCNQNFPDIAYEGSISSKTTYSLAAERLNNSFMFSWPRDIIIIDSLLLVHDSYNQAECFHIFNKYSGIHIKSFGKKGRGPREIIDINSVNNNYDGRSITIFDPNLKKTIIFDIINILQDSTPSYRGYSIMKSPNFIKQLIQYGDKFIAKGNSDKMRYGVWDPSSGHFSNIYTDFPKLTKDDQTNWSLTDYSVKVRLSPDGKKLVTGTYIGGILEIFDIEGDGIHPASARYFFEPHYSYAQGAIPKWVATTAETKIGFEDIFLNDKAIYGLIWEIERSSMNKYTPSIIRFDYQGDPISRYTFDDTLASFAVDNDNMMYGIVSDAQGQYSLNRYTIPD